MIMSNEISQEQVACIAPKTDQLNADNLRGVESVVVTIKGPCSRGRDGKMHIPLEECKPFKPATGQGRILTEIWGSWDKWPGRKMRLYRDPSVTFSGVACGGIKISEISHISKKHTVPVRQNRNKVIMQDIYPLKEEVDPVLAVQVKFRQAVTEGELKEAMAAAGSFTDQQKIRLTEDYRAALERIERDDKAG